ncbi:hypothetical protein HYH03_004435 [Edaphochlamys debaryana]|uniref:Phospholipase A1 n=1 Tax=Edaphochlamys debaryana TaxID=47281 RepID=A0A836C3D3_9CHLO|nr:hypothetical protein HYH03_004435 [Edaphochlamys debaryana]|eukprot:KAG2497698.1 hypothetical protein HYH03_004435 [Edaphochlamys debaryana]
MGFVAVSSLAGDDPGGERDVAFVWRGTIFNEEWTANFGQDWLRAAPAGHSLGGALATLSAYDIGLQLSDMWADPKLELERKGWKTKAMPKVTAITFASPRVGNFKFLEAFSDELRIRQLRVCNKGDPVPKFPGGWMQVLTSLLSHLGIDVYSDMDSSTARKFGLVDYWVSWFNAAVLHVKSRWNYFHVGTVLEVCLHFLDKKGTRGNFTSRNPLFLNKGDDVLVDQDYPADWWRAAAVRGYELQADGRWQYPMKPFCYLQDRRDDYLFGASE